MAVKITCCYLFHPFCGIFHTKFWGLFWVWIETEAGFDLKPIQKWIAQSEIGFNPKPYSQTVYENGLEWLGFIFWIGGRGHRYPMRKLVLSFSFCSVSRLRLESKLSIRPLRISISIYWYTNWVPNFGYSNPQPSGIEIKSHLIPETG